MQFKNNDKTEVLKTDHAVAYKLANTSLHEIVHLQLDKNGEIPSHALPINVVFYVLSGQGELIIDKDIFQAQTGDVLEVAAHTQRSWKNKSQTPLSLLVIKQNPA